jgi:two-component system sensor histidine kinase CpxA
LALARLESGDIQDRVESINLHEIVKEVAQDADFEAKSKHSGVVVLQNEEIHMVGNTELLCSALENVVRNAVRYTAEQTQVEIKLHRQENNAMIHVRDYGPGVPQEALLDLFQPFYRVAPARDRQSGGVGLGLAIAERAVRAHGGVITAANAPEGGLVVEISLPIKTQMGQKTTVK